MQLMLKLHIIFVVLSNVYIPIDVCNALNCSICIGVIQLTN